MAFWCWIKDPFPSVAACITFTWEYFQGLFSNRRSSTSVLQPRYGRSQSADPYTAENAQNEAAVRNSFSAYNRGSGGYDAAPPEYPPAYSESVVAQQGSVTQQHRKSSSGVMISKYPPWDPRWERDQQKFLKKQQEYQQKKLQKEQREAQKQMMLRQQQLRTQEAQIRRMEEEQARQFQEQQRRMQEEQVKQQQLLQNYAQLQQQQRQSQQYASNTAPANAALPYPSPAYGTYPGPQANAAANEAYANAYWAFMYRYYPFLFANYPGSPKESGSNRERDRKRKSRSRHRRGRHSRADDHGRHRRYKSNPETESDNSSELFMSASKDEEQEEDRNTGLQDQIRAQKNRLKKAEETPKDPGPKTTSASRDQSAFMAELQRKIRDKQNPRPGTVPAHPPPAAPEAIYGDPSLVYGYVPGAPLSVVPMNPIYAPYIAPGSPHVEPNTQDTDTDDGPVLPLSRNQPDPEAPMDDGFSAIYAVPQKRQSARANPVPPAAAAREDPDPDDYEEQASGLIIDDLDEDHTGVVDLSNKHLMRLDRRPDDVKSAVFSAADRDPAETVYATNEDAAPLDADAEAPEEEEEEEARMVLGTEDAPPGRGAADLGVWREDHGTQRSPPPSYFAFSPDEENNNNTDQRPHLPLQEISPIPGRRYQKARNNQPSNNTRVLRNNQQQQQQHRRYPVQPKHSSSSGGGCVIQ